MHREDAAGVRLFSIGSMRLICHSQPTTFLQSLGLQPNDQKSASLGASRVPLTHLTGDSIYGVHTRARVTVEMQACVGCVSTEQ
jgi:hypothetical protein